MTTTVPPVLAAVHVRRSPAVAFQVFTELIGDWWPLPTHGCFADRAEGVRLVDGKLVEQSVDGATAVWGEVLEWDPPHRFTCTWHPGYADARYTVVEIDFKPDDDGTRVELVHSGWEVFGDEAAGHRSDYDSAGGWRQVFREFEHVA